MQFRRDSACWEPACHEPLSGNVGFRDRRKGFARERGPLAVGCPSRTYRAGCVSTVVSNWLRGWLGESVPQQSVRHVTQDLSNLVAGGGYELYSAYPIRVPAVPASVIAAG